MYSTSSQRHLAKCKRYQFECNKITLQIFYNVPNKVTQIYFIIITDPLTVILGSPSIYVQVEISIILTCIIENTTKAPDSVSTLLCNEKTIVLC